MIGDEIVLTALYSTGMIKITSTTELTWLHSPDTESWKLNMVYLRKQLSNNEQHDKIVVMMVINLSRILMIMETLLVNITSVLVLADLQLDWTEF